MKKTSAKQMFYYRTAIASFIVVFAFMYHASFLKYASANGQSTENSVVLNTTDPNSASHPSSQDLETSGDDGSAEKAIDDDDDEEKNEADKEEKKEKEKEKEKKEKEKEKERKEKASKAEKELAKRNKKLEKALNQYTKGLTKALEKVKGTPAESVIIALQKATMQEIDNLLSLLQNDEKNGQTVIESLDDETLNQLLTQKVYIESIDHSLKEQVKLMQRLVDIYEKHGKKQAALAAQQKIISENPNDIEAYRKLSDLLKQNVNQKNIEVYVDGEPLSFDVAPRIENGRTLAPIRAISEALGLDVQYDASTQTITIQNGDRTVTLKVNQDTAQVNGQNIKLDVPAKIEKGRTLVPLRFLSQSLGADIEWFPDGQLIAIMQK